MQLNYDSKKEAKDIMIRAGLLGSQISASPPLFIKGDNFNALARLVSSGYRGKIDLIYIDPPFNTKQVFTMNTGRVSTISRGKNDIVAYGDHMKTSDFLEFIRERLILLKELLSERGSIYLHIDTKMGHYVKIIMDEVFGIDNFKNDITRIKSNPKNFSRKAYGNQKDVIYFYAKNKTKNIFNNVTLNLSNTDKERMFKKIDDVGRRYNTVPVHAPGETNGKTGKEWRGMMPPAGRHWRTDPDELDKLDAKGLLEWSRNGVPRIKKYADEHRGIKIQDIWNFIDPAYPLYPTEKNLAMLEMIIKQSSNEDSIVLDCFAGSGSTLLAAQNLNRKWIGIDQSDASAEVIRSRFKKNTYTYVDLTRWASTKKGRYNS